MKTIYSKEINLAIGLPSDSEKFQHFTSIIRSILQTATICSFEIVKGMTPYTENDANISPLLGRFCQPSDGLPIEALDALIPIIRSHVSKTYMLGWFEKDEITGRSLSQDLISWVEFRNLRPAHGVLDKTSLVTWSQKLEAITGKCLAIFSSALPKEDNGIWSSEIANDTLEIKTPLIKNNMAIVVSKITSRKGIWKMHAQSLSWVSADEQTFDLSSDNVFNSSDKPTEKFRLSEIEFESSVASIYNNIPVRQTNTFVGRSKELGQLAEWLDDFEDSRSCLVYGDGGFGKTTLVLEFFNKLLDGESTQPKHLPTLISYYTAKKTKWTENGLTHFKGISDAMEDSIRELLYFNYPVLGKEWFKIEGNQLIDKISGEISSMGLDRDDVLLILDNTETLATSGKQVEELSEFIKKVSKKIGRVVITSRRREFLPATPLVISSMPVEEASSLMARLGEEYKATAVIQASESRRRAVCKQLSYKPLLIDTLVKYISRSSSSLQDGLDQIFKKTNDELLEFLYEDAWLRINDLAQEVFLVIVNMTSPIDGNCVGDVCRELGIQHIEFQASLDETYFATITDMGTNYDLDIVDLARDFFRQKMRKTLPANIERLKTIAAKADRNAAERQRVEKEYKQDRVADAFRGQFAKAAKICTDKGDLLGAKENFELAIIEEPLNAALKDRCALFLLRDMKKPHDALSISKKAVELDPKNADASLTLALIYYELSNLIEGDNAINEAKKNGKPATLCYLRQGMARYHKAKHAPYSRNSPEYLKQAERFLEKSLASLDNKYLHIEKNKNEARKYLGMVHKLRFQINNRDILAEHAPKRQDQGQ